jgi:DNA-binding MarR family transcriptional regulator
VGQVLDQRLKQTRPLGDASQEAVVNLLLAGAWLNDRLEQALSAVDLSHSQYNVLRILKGVHPDGHPRCEVAGRMIDRAPDVTRIIDRLQARGLVERGRDAADARRSVTRITRKGLERLAEATQALRPVQREVVRRLSAGQLRQLSELCEALYGPDL